jgi:hypothetical protein
MSKLIEHALDKPEQLELMVGYLQGRRNIPLSPMLKEILDRLNFTYDQLIAYRQEKQVIAVLLHKYGYSTHQARADIQYAKRIYNYIPHDHKNFDYMFLVEQGWGLYNRAIEAGDLKTASSVYATIFAAHLKIRQEEAAKTDTPPPAFLVVQTNPELLGRAIPSEADIKAGMAKWLKSKSNEGDLQYTPFKEVAKHGARKGK